MSKVAEASPAATNRIAPKEVRRKQLIDATIASIAKHGISGTTMHTVTQAAGLSLGIVNFHFKSKELLLEETLRYLATEHRDAWMKQYRGATSDPAARLLAIVDAHFHPGLCCSRKKLAVWFAFYGEAANRRKYRQIMSEIDSERWTISEALCAQMVKEGGYLDLDPGIVAKTLEGLYDGLCLNILIYPETFTPADCKAQVRSYLAGLFPKHFPSA